MPDLPERRLRADGWELLEEREEIPFELSTVRVRGFTRIYEDGALRERIARATGIDHLWRFFFATRLAFSPPLPPVVGPATVFPTVRTEARRAFVGILRDRGFETVEPGRTERVRVRSGDRARLQSFDARLPLGVDGVDAIDVEGWLGAWITGGEFRLAGGAYPTDLPGLGAALGVEGDDLGPGADACRTELLGLLRAVE